VQLHGAHGYLVSNFISPHANERTDEYGGTSAERWCHVVTKGIKNEKEEAYFRSFAALFKNHLNVPVILVGGNRSFGLMEKLLITSKNIQ